MMRFQGPNAERLCDFRLGGGAHSHQQRLPMLPRLNALSLYLTAALSLKQMTGKQAPGHQ